MKIVRLGDHVKFLSGFAFKSKFFNCEKLGLPIIRIRDVVPGYSQTYYSGAYEKNYLVYEGDYLIGMDGNFNLSRWRSDMALLNQRVCKIHSLSKSLDRGYLVRFLPIALKEIEDTTPFVTVKHLSVNTLNQIQIPLPQLAEQKRIATILDAADALRAKRRKSIALLDSYLQFTFLDMFGDPVTNPMNWKTVLLQEVLKEKSINGAYYPKDAYSDNGTRMVHMGDAFNGMVNPTETKRVDASPVDIRKYALNPTDLLVSRRSLNYEGSAKPCLIPKIDEPLIFESSLIRVRPNLERVITMYLFHYLQNERARINYVFPLVTRSTISGINQSNLMKVKIILPPLNLQQRFTAIVESVECQKARLNTHLKELDTLFTSLQQCAFNGEL